jgi:glycine/D-amino acid oxidase-like deaminating enzyme/nitrite reductase/ring-hydroxylating ferredoxin subunit
MHGLLPVFTGETGGDGMKRLSLWRGINPPSRTSYPRLDGTLHTDVIIIGGGITGLTTALELLAQGLRVAVLEGGEIARGTTGDSTGNLYVEVQPFLPTVEQKRGREHARIVAQARKAAIDYIERMVQQEQMDCGFFRRPWHMFASTEEDVETVQREAEALRNAGMLVEEVEDWPLWQRARYAIRMNDQARVDPLAYTRALAELARNRGAEIFEQSFVSSFDENAEGCVAVCAHGRVHGSQIVVATHMPLGFNVVQTVAFPYRSYAIAVELEEHRYPDGMFWDTRSSKSYVMSTHSRDQGALDQLVIAGGDHKTGEPPGGSEWEPFKELEDYARRHYPVKQVTFQWSAQHYRPADSTPYIGLAYGSDRMYMATGFAADGLTWGTAAGLILSGLISRGDHPWLAAVDSRRFTPVASAKEFLVENAKVAKDYVVGFAGVSHDDVQDLAPGEAKVLKVNKHRCAAHRDAAGQLHLVSAVCTHMGCIVEWNNAEKSWDCPCHGSRFGVDGSVLEGPAMVPLPPVSLDD